MEVDPTSGSNDVTTDSTHRSLSDPDSDFNTTDPSSSTSSQSESSSLSSLSCPMVLPSGYRLSHWRVSDGSVVRIGETVAVMIPIDPSTTTDGDSSSNSINSSSNSVSSSNNSNSNPPLTLHKRPSRRKRALPDTSTTTIPTTAASKTAGDTTTTGSMSTTTTTTTTPHTFLTAPANGICRIKLDAHNVTTTHHNSDGDNGTSASSGSSSSRGVVVVGWIDPCTHPTVMAGLCAVCGNKVVSHHHNHHQQYNQGPPPPPPEGEASWSSSSSLGIDTNTTPHHNDNHHHHRTIHQNMTLMTVSGMTVAVSEQESQRMAQEDTRRLNKLRKLSLVLDLDHTLLHATADTRAEQVCYHRSDVRRLVLPFLLSPPPLDGTAQLSNMAPPPPPQYPGWLQQHFVKLRPHVTEFFHRAMDQYEIGVYTAGTRDYAEQVTILIARHLLGVTRDQIELEQLQQELVHMEQTYLRQQRAWTSQDSRMEQPTDDTLVEQVGIQASGSTSHDPEPPELNHHGTNNNNKRKRVQFEPPPAATKTDAISLDMLERLRAQVAQAERLERDAHDLRRRLFGSRVMSRTESGESGRHVKSLKRIFPCGGSMAAVIDDREDVWANAEEMMSAHRLGEPPENLLLVRPYHWSLFHGFSDVNNTSGMDFSQVDTLSSQVETDEQLLWTSQILKTLHERYYRDGDTPQRTVPMILEEMRSEVLKGCVVVLSGLIPLSKQQSVDQNQPRPSFVRYAESLGAIVRSNVSSDVTHVVAANDGTDKIMSARKIKGCYIVKPSWLVECYWSMTRRNENAHLLGTNVPVVPRPSSNILETNVVPKSSETITLHGEDAKQASDTTSSSKDDGDDDDDDDDFAAELENEFL